MKFTENALNVLTIKSYKGIGNSWILNNLKPGYDVDEIVFLLNKSQRNIQTTVSDFKCLKSKFQIMLEQKLHDFCDGVVAVGDKDFPRCQGKIKDSERPVFLYYKGNIDLLSSENQNIAVIGLLNPTEEIEERERAIVKSLVKCGATILSGLANGCDTIAHEQALDSNGSTIAVLPSPLNNILPNGNKRLAFRIVEEGGLLVTEYGREFKSSKELSSRYVERDRLQALFSENVVLAASYSQNSAQKWGLEGKVDSGARHAMNSAKQYGIRRSVMYDDDLDKMSPMFDLNRDIIVEGNYYEIISTNNIESSVNKIFSLK